MERIDLAVVGGQMIVDEVGSVEPIFICRGKYNSAWVPGQLIPNSAECFGRFGPNYMTSDFDILINKAGRNQVKWTPWYSSQTDFPPGAIATDLLNNKFFLAFVIRLKYEDHGTFKKMNISRHFSHFVGGMSMDDGIQIVMSDFNNNLASYNCKYGELLTEDLKKKTEVVVKRKEKKIWFFNNAADSINKPNYITRNLILLGEMVLHYLGVHTKITIRMGFPS